MIIVSSSFRVYKYLLWADPLANAYANQTPYNYANNSPAVWNDPTGACPECMSNGISDVLEMRLSWLYSHGALPFEEYGPGSSGAQLLAYEDLMDRARAGDLDALQAYAQMNGGVTWYWNGRVEVSENTTEGEGPYTVTLTGEWVGEKTSGICSTCNDPTAKEWASLSFLVGTGSTGMDISGAYMQETYTDVDGNIKSIYKQNRNGNTIRSNGKPIPNSTNALMKIKAISNLSTLGLLFNISGTVLSIKTGNENGWKTKDKSDFVAGLSSFVPGVGWFFSSLYMGIQSNRELVNQGTPVQMAPMSIVPGLGPGPVIK